MGSHESINRLVDITNRAEQDGIEPNELIRGIYRNAISVHNPLINPDHSYIVLGIDGVDGSIFPSQSVQTADEAIKVAKAKTAEEPLFSSGAEVSTTFYVFTKDGIHIPLESKTDDQDMTSQ